MQSFSDQSLGVRPSQLDCLVVDMIPTRNLFEVQCYDELMEGRLFRDKPDWKYR
jgi:hypothetical protein